MHRKVARLIPALGLSILIGVDIAGADWQLPPLDQVLAPEAGADSNPSTKAVSTKAASITAISFPGSTVPEAETLHALASEFIGQSTNRQQLERLRQRVNHLYQQLGMPGSGALMPRHLDSGHIEVPVVEGRLGVVEVIGLEGEDRAYIAQALDGLREEPLSRGRMLDRLRALEQSPGIESVQGELLPTTTLGVVDLRLRIVRANAWSSVWSLDNKRSPSVGGEQAGLSLTAMPLGDLSHTLNLQLGLHGDGGGGRFGLGYEHALNGPLSAVGFSLSRDDASLVEAPFDALDIDSRSDSFTLHAYQRAFPSENTEQRLGASFSLQRSRSRLLGRAFSFSPGEVNGESQVSLLSLEHGYAWRGADTALEFSQSLGLGLGILAATRHADLPDGRFLRWRFGLSGLVRINRHDQLLARLGGQWAGDSLLPGQRYAVGGADTVRGYRQNSLVRDNAAHFNLELRHALPLPGLSVGLFSDWALAWNRGDWGGGQRLHGLGLGLAWQKSRFKAELQLAKALREPVSQGDDLQDRGIHFSIQWQWP